MNIQKVTSVEKTTSIVALRQVSAFLHRFRTQSDEDFRKSRAKMVKHVHEWAKQFNLDEDREFFERVKTVFSVFFSPMPFTVCWLLSFIMDNFMTSDQTAEESRREIKAILCDCLQIAGVFIDFAENKEKILKTPFSELVEGERKEHGINTGDNNQSAERFNKTMAKEYFENTGEGPCAKTCLGPISERLRKITGYA
ncbi:MAG TPA: hypothetical protein PKL98_00025 [Candidatus Pacearchaeota archaeon]|nr:hypothetical protein [Candidatus Pacearchaeota archaeon]